MTVLHILIVYVLRQQVEWCGGPETMEEIVSRMQQREEATNKRERAMAYAFYHQVRLNTRLL